jgi:hypothetical protein
MARRPVSRPAHAAWPAGSLLLNCWTQSPVICLVVTLIRFQVLIVAIEITTGRVMTAPTRRHHAGWEASGARSRSWVSQRHALAPRTPTRTLGADVL